MYNLKPEIMWLYQAIVSINLAGHNFKDEREVETGVLNGISLGTKSW
jgi:hypothetical protein